MAGLEGEQTWRFPGPRMKHGVGALIRAVRCETLKWGDW